MPTKNSRTLSLEEVKEAYEKIQDENLRYDEIIKIKGEEILVQNIVSNLCWMLYSGETASDFECCKPGCTTFPCQ